jgi:galactokinase
MDSTSGFANAYQRSPDVVWSAPGRANLIGEHTDYNDGFVLPFAIAERTEVAAARRGDETIMVASRGYSPAAAAVAWVRRGAPGRAPGGWSAYPLGVAWAIAQVRSLPPGYGVSLYIDSDVPPGAGLSSSAALEMAVAGALADRWGLDLSAAELARAGQRAENEVVGAPTGIMDQYASLLGEADAAVFLDCRTLETRSVPLRLARAGLALVLADTGERHAHAAGGYAARRESCERAARQLGVPALRDLDTADLPRIEAELDDETFRRVRHVVTENARVKATVTALEAGAMKTVGRRARRPDDGRRLRRLDHHADRRAPGARAVRGRRGRVRGGPARRAAHQRRDAECRCAQRDLSGKSHTGLALTTGVILIRMPGHTSNRCA